MSDRRFLVFIPHDDLDKCRETQDLSLILNGQLRFDPYEPEGEMNLNANECK